MILVTGANGMVGNATVDQLLEYGEKVRCFDLAPHSNPHVESIVGDIRNLDEVRRACVGVEGVIHTASLVDLHLGKPHRLYDINVNGVEKLITACNEAEVRKLVYMSSAEVISGASPLRHADEQTAYPNPHLTYYGVTKEAAERRVLAANGDKLATCAFRTYGIFGERDRNFVRRAMDKARGKQVTLVGNNSGVTDAVYAGNIAHALILGHSQLEINGAISGQIFHVTDHKPQSIQDFILEVIEPLGYKRSQRKVSFKATMTIARMFELRYQLSKAERFANPLVTRHQLLLATQDYYLDSQKVREMLNYSPKFSRPEAIERTQQWLMKQ